MSESPWGSAVQVWLDERDSPRLSQNASKWPWSNRSEQSTWKATLLHGADLDRGIQSKG